MTIALMIDNMTRKDSYKRGFTWGKREHQLEGWTNDALVVTLIIFSIAFYFHSWFFMHFAFAWLVISLIIHFIARFCHSEEKKWHKQANSKPRGFFNNLFN